MKLTVKAARVNAKLSQDAVAEALGMSINTYKHKENGKSRFYADELSKLSRLFNVDVTIFFELGCPYTTKGVAGNDAAGTC